MTVRERVHQLADELTDEDLVAAERYLTHLREQGAPALETRLQADAAQSEPIAADLVQVSRALKAAAGDRFQTLVEQARGSMAHVPLTVEDFCQRKQEEIELENRHLPEHRTP